MREYEVRCWDWEPPNNLVDVFRTRKDAEEFRDRMDDLAMRCYIVVVEDRVDD